MRAGRRAVDAAVGMRAATLLRRHLLATVVLGVFAGLAGGAAIGAWGIARRTESSYDRFLAYEDAATYHVMACPPGADPDDPDWFDQCRVHDQADILDYLRTVPGVDEAGRWSFAIASAARAETPDEWANLLVPFPIDEGALASMGQPIVVEGRLADQHVATEVVVNEELAELGGVGVGDQIVITVASADEFDLSNEARARPTGKAITADIVGIVRRPGDLTLRRMSGDGSIVDSLSRAEATLAFAQLIGLDFARYGIGVVVHTDTLGADDVMAALAQGFPDREIQLQTGSPNIASDPASVLDAIELQALAMLLLSVVAGIAAAVFAGQAISRQTRREWEDAATLSALGMTRPTMVAAALMRSIATAAVAVVVALGLAIGLSPLGPTGVARLAEPHPGVSLDRLALAIGLPLVALAVIAFSTAPVAALRSRSGSAAISTRTTATPPYPSPSFGAGWAMTRSRRAGGFAIGSAVAGVTLATATGVAAWALTTSYDDLLATPARYGAEWDALVGNVSTDEQADDTERRLAAIPGLRAVRILSLSGVQPDPEFTLTAAAPIVGEVSFGTVVRGRPPATSDEVALGAQTMDDLGVSLGDEIVLPLGDAELGRPFEVVGEAIVNDGFESRPGNGALVTPQAFHTIAPGGDGSTYAVWVDDDVDRRATLAQVREAFPTTYVEPRPADKIANLRHVADQPKLLTLVVGLLAGAALVHALVMSVVRSRRQIGVLKTLGFTRRQVIASVGWHATTIAVAALAIGIPLGIVGGRLAWTSISGSLGLHPRHTLPVSAMLVVAAVVMVIANTAALLPGIAAARTRTSTALRVE